MIIGLVFLFLCLCLSILLAVLKFACKASKLVIRSFVKAFVLFAGPLMATCVVLYLCGVF